MATRPTTFNLTAVEWTSAIFGIPWSVWWARFIEKWVSSCRNEVTLFGVVPISKIVLLTLSAIVIGLFVVVYVRWLWEVSDWGPQTTFVRVCRGFRDITIMGAALVLAVGVVSQQFRLTGIAVPYGAMLTTVWIILPPIQTIFWAGGRP